ncbi:dihydropteroate synthase [Flectobacillus sp. BAB-3569]|uniref:dihydropteroate synthase n=1 Tax=Flectobacillus sp. BAB-3569 TaxID=1509483 RepID=UPI000BA3CC47|nr:dihydropteroate synthase [Flectobacillus sp. BAB-3569]PAC31038.1 dihydropteroate synthase [Flectobacillus sp. BAB-3569]
MTTLINCRGKLIDLAQPRVMGILNITPDSFFERSRVHTETEILNQAEKMLSAGATFLDLGGHSTRPGATPVSEEEEIKRVLPATEIILKYFPEALISIDTFRSNVAKACVEAGAVIVNDVSGGLLDDKMYETVASFGDVPYILMHMRGTIETMTQLTQYDNLVLEVLDELQQKVAQLRTFNQRDIILDLGFGFAKNLDQNYELLNHLPDFEVMNLPMLVGVSRKSMIWRKLDILASEALNGTTALNVVALMKGANILRVHDVKEAIETISLIKAVNAR